MIPLARPWLGEEEARAASEAVLSGWIMQGPRVAEFERRFAEYCGAPHACAVSSGTAALELALRAVGVTHGDVVLTVSHSFIATANAVRACGAEPVFVDIEAGGYNIDLAQAATILQDACAARDGGLYYRDIERLLTLSESPLRRVGEPRGRVAALLVVHQIGRPCDLDAAQALAARWPLPLVEDAACAVGSEWRGRRIGAPHGVASCFSFHPRKLVTTGDGGMITTADPTIDARCRLLRQHGMVPPSAGGHFEHYERTAYNYRLTDVQAAIGLAQLDRLPALIAGRRERVAHYRARLAGLDGFVIAAEAAATFCNWQSLPLEFATPRFSQTALLDHLRAHGITAKPGIANAHEQAPYAGPWSLPESEARRRGCLFLPLYHDLADAEIDQVVAALESFARTNP